MRQLMKRNIEWTTDEHEKEFNHLNTVLIESLVLEFFEGMQKLHC